MFGWPLDSGAPANVMEMFELRGLCLVRALNYLEVGRYCDWMTERQRRNWPAECTIPMLPSRKMHLLVLFEEQKLVNS